MTPVRKSIALAFSALAITGLSVLANDPLSISQSQSVESFSGKDVTISGKTDVHLTSATGLDNATVNLKGENAWLYVDNVRPSYVLANYLKNISVDGVAADIAANVRLAEYRGGTVVIPHGYESYANALTVYDQPNCQGNAKEVSIETYHTDLGDFDNNIRSFKLKKGFQVCFANNSDCSGFSRIYIAADDDLVVNELPEGFVTTDGSDKAFISFIRVVKHQWVSKKGWAGNDATQLALTKSTHHYGWNGTAPGDSCAIDREFVPHRHHVGWPSFDEIKRQTDVSHLLGDNEPDNTNDANEHPNSPYTIACLWPEYVRTGLRLGSPAPTGVYASWLSTFFNLMDSLNYRVDFVVYHQYIATTDFSTYVNKAVSVSKGRPVWITEWNNGANWTTESWPTASGPARDADSNIIYYKLDENGEEVICDKNDEGAYTKTVTRPLTSENAAKQLTFMKTALSNQDNLDKLERLNFYNWVQDARACVINNKLTPAGKYFADYNAKLAYNKDQEFVHTWKIAPPIPLINYSTDYKNVRLTWYDHNGETGKSYSVYRRDGSGAWILDKTLELGKDYQAGEDVVLEEKIDMADKRSFRISATSYKGDNSINSRIVTITRDQVYEAPELTATAVDPYSVQLTWTAAPGARAYRLERRDADDAEFKVVRESLENTTFSCKDNGLSEKHDYWYRISVLSNADETPVSEIVKVHTPSLSEAPEAVYDLVAAAGDGRVTLSWSNTYQTTWTVDRADSPDGPFTTVKSNTSNLKFIDKDVVNGQTYYYKVTPKRMSLVGTTSDVISATPEEGHFVYVPFCEGKGTTAKDYYSNNNAKLNGAINWVEDRFGNARNAVSINSAGSGYVSLPEKILNSTNDFTVALWFKKNSDSAKGRVFDFGSDTNNFMILDYGMNNASGFRFKFKGGGVEKNVDCNYDIEADKWYHVAVSQSSKKATVYVNGEAIGTMTGSNNPSVITPTNIWFGRSQWSSDAYADFSYDDLYIYNNAMSDEEIKELMSHTITDVEDLYADQAADGLSVSGHGSEITIVADKECHVNIYSVDGALVRSANLVEGVNILSGFSRGIYVVASHKVIL